MSILHVISIECLDKITYLIVLYYKKHSVFIDLVTELLARGADTIVVAEFCMSTIADMLRFP